MSVFQDKKFEGLDYVSQLIEPIDSQLNVLLGELPDEFIIDAQTLRNLLHSRGSSYLSKGSILNYILSTLHLQNFAELINSASFDAIEKCFELHVDDNNIIFDFDKNFLSQPIKLIKVTQNLDDKILEKLLGQEGLYTVYNCDFSQYNMSRANDIMEMLGECESGIKTKTYRKKRSVVLHRLEAIFRNNEWKIKDMELANKVGYWVRSYIEDGNIAALSNLCRLKVMTHTGNPIYSMKEVK